MTVLEQINQMQSQGMPEPDIFRQLEEQGVNPREIQEAFNQLQIKNAIAGEEMQPQTTEQEIIDPNQQQEMPAENYPQEQYPQNQYAQQGGDYYNQGYGYPEAGAYSNTDNSVEIAEQVFSEKIKKFQKNLDELKEFKSISEVKLENLDKRLRKIEELIDNLQIKILQKVGSYGEDLSSIRKEMSMISSEMSKSKKHQVKK